MHEHSICVKTIENNQRFDWSGIIFRKWLIQKKKYEIWCLGYGHGGYGNHGGYNGGYNNGGYNYGKLAITFESHNRSTKPLGSHCFVHFMIQKPRLQNERFSKSWISVAPLFFLLNFYFRCTHDIIHRLFLQTAIRAYFSLLIQIKFYLS